MTRGEASGDDDIPNSSRSTARQSLARQSQPTAQVNANRPGSRAPENRRTDMPPPLPPAAAAPRSRPIRPLTGTPSASRETNNRNTENERPAIASMEFDSLFVPADDDRQWDVPNDEEEAEDMLGWDATADQVSASGHCRGVWLIVEPCRRRLAQASGGCKITSLIPCAEMSQLSRSRMIWEFHPHSACPSSMVSVSSIENLFD